MSIICNAISFLVCLTGADQDPEVLTRGGNHAPEALTRGGDLEAGVVGHTPDPGQGHTKDEGQGHAVAHRHSHLVGTSPRQRADHAPLIEIDKDQRTISLPWQTVHTHIRIKMYIQVQS